MSRRVCGPQVLITEGERYKGRSTRVKMEKGAGSRCVGGRESRVGGDTRESYRVELRDVYVQNIVFL